MTGYLFGLLVALLAGAAMAIQGSINSLLSKNIGLLETTLLVHAVGLVFLGGLFALQLGNGNLAEIGKAPWYSYLGGVLGVIIVYGVVVAILRAGVANATTAIIVSQLTTALIVDHFGLFGLETIHFNWYKLAGLILLAAGSYLVLGMGNN